MTTGVTGMTAVGTITATTAPGFRGALVNLGRISAATIDPVTDNNEDSATGRVTARADLSITKTITSGPLVAGGPADYVLTVRNDGPSTARDIVVADLLPAALFGTAAETEDGTCTISGGRDVRCVLDSLAPRQETTTVIRSRIDPAYAGALDNAASVTSATTDPRPANNLAEAAGVVRRPPPCPTGAPLDSQVTGARTIAPCPTSPQPPSRTTALPATGARAGLVELGLGGFALVLAGIALLRLGSRRRGSSGDGRV